MKRKWITLLASVLTFLTATLHVWGYVKTEGDDEMVVSCAENFDEMNDYKEYAELEYKEKSFPRWGFPLPRHLLIIGGIDHISWARVCRHDNDPEGIFRGEVLDHGVHYIGQFRYDHREGKPLPYNVFRYYRMASLSGADVLFRQDASPPVDYFYLRAIDPDGFRQPLVDW